MSQPSTAQIYPISPTPHPERQLGLKDLVTFACGMVISSAVFSLQGPATALAGRAAWLAYLAAVVLGFFTVLPYFLICGALNFNGGDYAIVAHGLGKLPSGLYVWNFIAMNLAFSISASSIKLYVLALWPNAPALPIALLVVTFFFALNILSLKVISRMQNVMFYLLMAAFGIYIIYGMTQLQPGTFDIAAQGYFRQGPAGFRTAITTLTFSTTVYVTVMNLGTNAKNPRKHVPYAMVIAALIILVAYVFMSLVSSNAAPIEEIAGQSVIHVAKRILPTGLFIFFVIFGPFMAVATTLNAGFLGSAKPFERATEKGWFPKQFGWKNKFGAPVWCVFALFCVTVIPLLVTDDVATLANSATLVQLSVKLLTLVAAWNIPRKFPQYWSTGLFRKMPLWVFYAIMTVCTVAQVALIIMSMMSLTTMQVIVSLSCMAVLTACGMIWYKCRGSKINTEFKAEELS